MSDVHTLRRILDLARWAPSGDNSQPWRFEITGADRVVIHAFDTRQHCVYDLDGRASQIAQGALLETIRIAATGERLSARVERVTRLRPDLAAIEVLFEPDAALTADPLLPFVTTRCTQRRAMPTKPLGTQVKRQLERSAGADHEVVWFEGLGNRARFARLMLRNGKLRLTLPEAYPVHRDVIEWGASESADRIPERAIGVDPATAKLMKWALKSWGRVAFLNRYLAGTLVPRLQLDLVPSLACAAHFAIFSRAPLVKLEDYLAGGAAMQRLWLSATAADLQAQPEMTPVIFARYVRERQKFTSTPRLERDAVRIEGELGKLMPRPLERLVFMGRIGLKTRCEARSLRLPLAQLTAPVPEKKEGAPWGSLAC